MAIGFTIRAAGEPVNPVSFTLYRLRFPINFFCVCTVVAGLCILGDNSEYIPARQNASVLAFALAFHYFCIY